MTQALASKQEPQSLGAAIEQVLIKGDLGALSPEQRVAYYNKVCGSLGLNPLTKPFEYLRLNNKEVLYATRNATEQLRRIYRVSITIVARERHDDVYVVTARGITADGRSDESVGAVPIAGVKGESLANAFMKAETKAKRRVTLSLCGLGMLDETEVESIPNARVVDHARPVAAIVSPPHDRETGEVLATATATDAFPVFAAEIRAASDLTTLNGIGKRIKGAGLARHDIVALQDAYARRSSDIRKAQADAAHAARDAARAAKSAADADPTPQPGEDDSAGLRRALIKEASEAREELPCSQVMEKAAERAMEGMLSQDDVKAIQEAANARIAALRHDYNTSGYGRYEQ